MVWDRAYRLRYNKGQCHMDLVTYGAVGESRVDSCMGYEFVHLAGSSVKHNDCHAAFVYSYQNARVWPSDNFEE